MPIYLDPPLPLHKSAEITKHLRSRDVALVSLLPVARSIFESSGLGDSGVYFPQKEEWLLEWVVQRLREDDDAGAIEARRNPEFWEFILHLLPASTSASAILKKHNILQLIFKIFSEAALLLLAPMAVDFSGDTIMMDEEVDNTQDIGSSPTSSSTERGSSAEITAPHLLELLKSVSMVLLYIQQNWAAGSREGNVVTVLRGTPEIGAQILGSYLEALQVLVQCGLELEEKLTSAVVNIWRSCIWGNPNSKKLSILFSNCCLVPATRIISTPHTPAWFRSEMNQLITEFIFSHEAIFPASNSGINAVNPSSKNLRPLLAPLTVRKECLPHIFKIGIISQTRKQKPNSDTIEVIFNSIISGALGTDSPTRDTADSDLGIIMEMLEVLVDTGTMISSETLARLVDSISNLLPSDQGSVRWDIIEVALKLDFDIFLGKGNETRVLKLTDTLTKNGQDGGMVFRVIELLMDGFARARDLEGFAKIWISELSKEENGVWENDKVAKLFADQMEKGLLAEQINKILKTACQEESWVVIDAVLRGVRREATEDKLRGSLLGIAESVSKGGPGWRGWRVLVRALRIDKGLVRNVERKALKAMKKSAAGTTRDQARETLFVSEVLMTSMDLDVLAEVVNVAVEAMKSVQKGWDGCIGDIHEQNLGVALVTGFTSRSLRAFELVSSDVRTRFVDEFLNMATRSIIGDAKNITGRTAWRGMLSSGVFYEYPAFKDAVLAALITKLEFFLDISVDLKTSLEDARKGNDSINQDAVNRYEFLMESIASYPLEAIKRATRERILDALVLLDAKLEVGRVYEGARGGLKRLVEMLWGLGNASSFLARDAGGFMGWVKGGGDKAGRKILRFVLATKDQERSRLFLTRLAELAEGAFLLMGAIAIEVLKVCEIIVDEFWQAGEESVVKRLRNGILQKLRESIEAGQVNSQLVGVWRRMWILDPNSNDKKEALKLAQGIIEGVKTALPKVLAATGHPEDSVKEATGVVAEAVMLLCACSKTEEESVNTTALAICILDSQFVKSYKSQIIVAYESMVAHGLGPVVYLGCLERVVDGCFTLRTAEPVQPGYWEILKILVYGAKQPEGDELCKRMTACLSTVLSNITQNLPKARTENEFLAISDCIYTILREKTWAVLQYNIDEILASITISSSPSGPYFPLTAIAPDEIFIRLCNIFRVIMTLHRRRVRGGRYHLVIAALQSLLHCIYKPKAPGERKKSDKVVHPPWLLLSTSYCNSKTDIGGTDTTSITRKRVEGFNRLVTTFCEPSASSVRDRTRKKNDHSLVHSVRDREKREVASCVGGLLGEILKGGLGGGFEGDITVSVGAIFEALGPEGVKAFAKTIDRESRAMLRELWDEYNRVGGGGLSEKL